MTVEINHGALADSYEKQMNQYGFTYGEYSEWVENIGFGLVCAHIHGCITDSEYDKILQRFQKNILLSKDYLKRLEGDAECPEKKR